MSSDAPHREGNLRANFKNPRPLDSDKVRSMQKADNASGVKANNSNSQSNEKSVRTLVKSQ